ncbi:MAG: phage tail sheath subtilisin-like domain-containing protein, partial [Deltaproteobacteria bacterium]
MRERLTPGIHVAVEVGVGQSIARVATATAAFVGRALRGPVNRPVLIHSFADFQAVFGGLWQPSTLSYAIEQYFENGGQQAHVVRVVNGARPSTLTLTVPQGPALTLEACCPGTREFLRAAVDYDNIPATDLESFNLVVHRVRAPGSEHVEDQEIYERLSVAPDSPRFVAVLLADSALVRLRGEVPLQRPAPTCRGESRAFASYANSNPDGDDGGPLTDYDVIGSATARTGLFAFGEQDAFNFLCLPPLGRDSALGASVLLVAKRLCRERRALLMVDPPADWNSPAAAIAGLRNFHFGSDNALMYFPWIQAYDRLRGRFETFPPGAAAAGMLARLESARPLWSGPEGEDGPLRPGLRPGLVVAEEWRSRLAEAGINTLQAVRARRAIRARTLAGPRASSADWRFLGRRRLALFVVESIVRGTRWVLFEAAGAETWRRLESQIGEFFAGLERDGAFAGALPGQAWFAISDERVNPARQLGGVQVLFGYAAGREGEWHCWLLSHGPQGSRVQAVSLNRLQSAGGRPPLDPDFDVATLLCEQLR